MNVSNLLKELLEEAKKIENPKGWGVTAERLIVAAIDKVITKDSTCNSLDDELVLVELVLKAAFDDLKVARELLTWRISLHCSAREQREAEKYLIKHIEECGGYEREGECRPLRTEDLLMSIFQDPSYEIRAGMKMKKSGTGTSEERENGRTPGIEEKPQTTSRMERPKTSAPKMADISALISELKKIREILQKSVHGQNNAINVFITGYFQASMQSLIDNSKERPRATFLFAGPPGVGKTFLAEKAAEALGLPFRRFDMSEYCDKEASLEFCGSDKVYTNGKAGNFTSFIDENPKCIVLLDEIEKAHISIIHLFLQVLDAGRLRDSYTDKILSFKDVILIFTTNAGKQLYQDCEDTDLSTVSRKVVIDALKKDVNPSTGIPYFPEAICSRFAAGNVVMFNHIDVANLHLIVKEKIEKQASGIKSGMNISISIDPLVYAALLLSEGGRADARTMSSRAEAFLNNEMYELFRLISSEKGSSNVEKIEKIEKIEIDLDMDSIPQEIRELFIMDAKKQVLVLADQSRVQLCKSGKVNCNIIGAQTCKEAMDVLKKQDIDLALLDVRFGEPQDMPKQLNIEDVNTPARELLQALRDQQNIPPIYLLEDNNNAINDEEKVSYTRQGVRGCLAITYGTNVFAVQMNQILSDIHYQSSMEKLARENKLVSFETTQSVSMNGKIASIRLFDFKTVVAVESEDTKDILGPVSTPKVRFDEVIGCEDAKTELRYFVEYLRNPKKYIGTGVKAPRGVLLYGPPGTGKTMLARAMASEAGVTFIATEGNRFLKKHVGEGSEEVRKLFRIARKYAPSILFIDEIDAIAKERRGGVSGQGSEDTLTSFLTQMDGFASDPTKPVFVLAATNFDVEPGHDKSLDPALMRRFDRRVYIDLPNKADRIEFLNEKIAKNPALKISKKQVESISMRATGMSLAELDSVVELALRSAIRQGSTVVNDAILEEAFEIFTGGEAKKWDASQLERTARHEAGHALLCWLSGETPAYLTIVARGNRGGYMQSAENEGKAVYTKDELLARIRTALGGRAAEIVYYGLQDGMSTGASSDLLVATNIAQQIVCSLGMDDDFGLAVLPDAAASGSMSAEIRTFVNRILKEQMSEAVRLVSQNKEKIDALVDKLLAKNHMNRDEIEKILKR